MYTVRKQFSFSAAHQLQGLAQDHPCMRLHGHNYIVEVVLSVDLLNDDNFVRDYRELDEFKDHIDTYFDHRNLNDVVAYETTAENLARGFFVWCHDRWPETRMVRVSETPKTWAEYSDGYVPR